MTARTMQPMSKPAKPGAPRRIDVQNEDQIILLALSALFTVAHILRDNSPSRMIAQQSVECAKALIDAAVEPKE